VDDVNILRIFRSILEKEGYVIDTVETGKDALKKIRKEKFNVCLVDVRLPNMEGTELLLDMAEFFYLGKPTSLRYEVIGAFKILLNFMVGCHKRLLEIISTK